MNHKECKMKGEMKKMLEELELKLEEERKLKARLVAPIDRRIKNLQIAINKIKAFNNERDIAQEETIYYSENISNID